MKVPKELQKTYYRNLTLYVCENGQHHQDLRIERERVKIDPSIFYENIIAEIKILRDETIADCEKEYQPYTPDPRHIAAHSYCIGYRFPLDAVTSSEEYGDEPYVQCTDINLDILDLVAKAAETNLRDAVIKESSATDKLKHLDCDLITAIEYFREIIESGIISQEDLTELFQSEFTDDMDESINRKKFILNGKSKTKFKKHFYSFQNDKRLNTTPVKHFAEILCRRFTNFENKTADQILSNFNK